MEIWHDMKIAFFLLLWLLPISANVYADRKGRKPHYFLMFILRGMAAFAHWFLFIREENNVLLFWLVMFQVTSFWLIFEIWVNLLRGREVFYYDRTELDSGWVDRFFAKRQGWHFAAKVLAFVVMVYSITRIYALY